MGQVTLLTGPERRRRWGKRNFGTVVALAAGFISLKSVHTSPVVLPLR